MKHVFGTVGLPGSGKSTFTDIAEDVSDNVETVSLGDIVRKLAKEEGHTSSEAIGNFATRMREEHGRGIFAEKLIEEMEFSDDAILVIDGIRSPPEIKKLRETTECECTIVYISADQDVRYERVVNRGRENEDEMSLEDFNERDEREIGWGFNEIIEDEHYDSVIHNENSYKEFQREVEQVIEQNINLLI